MDHAQGLPAYDGSIDMVLRYIQKNYQTCSLKSIAGITRLNMNYLSTAFKMKTGTSFHEYVTAVRLKKACELLLKGEEKPNKIAQDVGYADTTVLNRVFKKKYGMGIREYQIRHRIGDLDGQP